jgi:hypothetical protein
MAKKKSKAPSTAPATATAKKKPTISYTFKWLNQDVADAVADDISSVRFNKKGENPTHEYQTHVMGGFTCDNDLCGARGWFSKKVSIVIKGYPDNGYYAVVFNQRCKSCQQLGTLNLHKESYIERVAYRLRKWAGVEVEAPTQPGPRGLPHEDKLCEGCKAGYCMKGYAGKKLV